MKKAQLTLMIIIGIVMLVSVGIAIWITGTTMTRRTEPEAEQQRLRQIAIQPVKDYIQSCLDITTSTALELIGKQGGVIYESQGGLTEDVLPQQEGEAFVLYDDLNVSYLIKAPSEDIGTFYFAEPPDYPFVTFPYVINKTGVIIRESYIGHFGRSELAPLHKPGNKSIQEQIEAYINHSLPLCTDWSVFADQGLEIVDGMPNTNVTIAENLSQVETEQYFSVLIDWEVNVSDLSTGGTTALTEFFLSYPVHLAKFYLFVQNIVLSDISNSSFDPRTVSTDATPVLVIEGANNNYLSDDIIIVQDRASQLRGKPLEFRILRQNRIPALKWIDQTDLDDYEFVPTKTCGLDSDNIFLSDSTLKIKWGDPSDWIEELEAVDPDEDVATFRTEPPAPAQISVPPSGAGEIYFRLYVYATDGEKEDHQIVKLHTAGCPR